MQQKAQKGRRFCSRNKEDTYASWVWLDKKKRLVGTTLVKDNELSREPVLIDEIDQIKLVTNFLLTDFWH